MSTLLRPRVAHACGCCHGRSDYAHLEVPELPTRMGRDRRRSTNNTGRSASCVTDESSKQSHVVADARNSRSAAIRMGRSTTSVRCFVQRVFIEKARGHFHQLRATTINTKGRSSRRKTGHFLRSLVGATGFEPATPRSRTECSTRLSHAPTTCLAYQIDGASDRMTAGRPR